MTGDPIDDRAAGPDSAPADTGSGEAAADGDEAAADGDEAVGNDDDLPPSRLAVVGTGTGVGKTVVTAGLTAWLRDEGVAARAVKPAQTGHPPDDDAGFVARACDDPDAAVCTRHLEPPLAPRVAAEVTGTTLEYDSLIRSCRDALADCDVGVVEGIGGLRVPLAVDAEVIDLVADLDCEAVVVARSGLGTLNHTALSVDALERRGVPVRAIVCNEYAGETTAERTNPAELERMTGRPVETIPPLDGSTPAELAAGVRDALTESAVLCGLRSA